MRPFIGFWVYNWSFDGLIDGLYHCLLHLLSDSVWLASFRDWKSFQSALPSVHCLAVCCLWSPGSWPGQRDSKILFWMKSTYWLSNKGQRQETLDSLTFTCQNSQWVVTSAVRKINSSVYNWTFIWTRYMFWKSGWYWDWN